jgi:uncharacterized Zn-binding protein involved in type VI secretion
VFPAVRESDIILSPVDRHLLPLPIVASGTRTVLIGGRPAATLGDRAGDIAGAARILSGSTTVLIGGRSAARISDEVANGGMMATPGWPIVLIGD